MLDSSNEGRQWHPEHREDQTSHCPTASSDSSSCADPDCSPLRNLQVCTPHPQEEVDGCRLEEEERHRVRFIRLAADQQVGKKKEECSGHAF